MTDVVNHECGIALLRLLKPLEYYQLKYGTWKYGINKLYLLMEKQHNRGQDGAGIASVKLDMSPGKPYIDRERSARPSAIDDIFKTVRKKFEKNGVKHGELADDPSWAKENLPFAGELLLGHLRYGTYGKNDLEAVHPVMRVNNWKTRNLLLAGNFNLTNVDELFDILIDLGQHPRDFSDTVTILENVGHFLDREIQSDFDLFRKNEQDNKVISDLISENLKIDNFLREASKKWDGGYVIAGLLGHGDSFVIRDPWGIRPAFYYADDEIAVVTSERPAIQTVFNAAFDNIKEVPPGSALIFKKTGKILIENIRGPFEKRSCSFERIYFSRGNDKDIYQERKKLGELLAPKIVETLNNDLENSVFSFIPNTAETAFYGMLSGIEMIMKNSKKERILLLGSNISEQDIDSIIYLKPRVEKIAIKDIKLRTFITGDSARNDLVGHVYDITYGTIRENLDNLVVIDDSIVRGTTLKYSIIKILDRLKPKSIVIVSSSPQIRYPDCYGIDMAKLGDFIAFKAAMELLKETGQESVINAVYNKAKESEHLKREEVENHIKEIYLPFTPEAISGRIAKMLRTPDICADVKVVYQTVENLHMACPAHKGDWYFTGDYPTPGGNRVSNRSFINYIEGRNVRAY
jgi:amidophosphoribosyltransferase